MKNISRESIPKYLQEKVSRSPNWYDRARVALQENVESHILDRLSLDMSAEVRNEVAKNPNSQENHLMNILKRDPTCWISIAENKNITQYIAGYLSKVGSSEIRRVLAANPMISEDIMLFLSKDGDSQTREGVAKNTSCPVNILEKLMVDNDHYVRLAVSKNPNVETSQLKKLSEDAMSTVSTSAKMRL